MHCLAKPDETHNEGEHDGAEPRGVRLERSAVREFAAVDSLPAAAVVEPEVGDQNDKPVDDAGDGRQVDEIAANTLQRQPGNA